MVALLVATLTFTVPAYQPDTLEGTCEARSGFQIPESPLRLKVQGWSSGGLPATFYDGPVSFGPQSMEVPWDGVSPWTYCLTLKDPAGNESCRSCVALGDWPVGVPNGGLEVLEVYDVTGRRAPEDWQKRRGVYFRRWLLNGEVVRSRPVIVTN